MKRSIAVICSLLLITHAIVVPINSMASQTVEGVVKEEESSEDDNLALDEDGKVNEESNEEVSDNEEEISVKEESVNVEENTTEEENITEEEDDNQESNVIEEESSNVEDDAIEDESINIEGDVTEDMGEDLLEGIEYENLTYDGTIQIDGMYSDWKHIPHTDISWYSPDPDKVHQGALYLDGDILYGHFKMNDAYKSQMIVAFMELTINNSTSVGLTIQKGTPDGDIDWSADMYNLPQGITTGLGVFYTGYPKYYMGESVFTVYDSNHLIGDEVEFAIDLNVISKITDIPIESMREIKLYNPNIGSDAIVIAGSSSGAVVGVIFMTVIAAGGVLYLRRKRISSCCDEK